MGRQKIVLTRAIKQLKPYPIVTFFHGDDAEMLNEAAAPVALALNSSLIKNHIERLKLSAIKGSTAVLTSTQIGINKSFFTVQKNAKDCAWFHEDGNLVNVEDYQSFINPKILAAESTSLVEEENCSFPFIHAKIRRYKRIKVQYFCPDRNTEVKEQLTGFQAILFQQGLDFLIGRHILDWRLHFGHIWMQSDVQEKMPKTTALIEEYSAELKKMFKKFPSMASIPEELEEEEEKGEEEKQFGHSWVLERGNPELLSIENDYLMRMHKYYNREMALLMERLNEGVIKP